MLKKIFRAAKQFVNLRAVQIFAVVAAVVFWGGATILISPRIRGTISLPVHMVDPESDVCWEGLCTASYEIEWEDWLDRCETNPESCENPVCPLAKNATCQQASYNSCEEGQCKVFYKVMFKNPSQKDVALPDGDLSDDIIAVSDEGETEGTGLIGVMDKFFSFFDFVGGMGFCKKQHRNYAYIYIPEGWWDFTVAANQATTEPDECYYCPIKDGWDHLEGCVDNNVLGPSWKYVKGKLETPIKVTCDDFPRDEKHNCKPDCQGKAWVWIGAKGQGTLDSPYTKPTYYPEKSLEERYLEIFQGSNGSWRQIAHYNHEDVDPSIFTTLPEHSYSYSWITPPDSSYPDSGNIEMTNKNYATDNYRNSEWTAIMGNAEISMSLGSSKPIESIKATFLRDDKSWVRAYLPSSLEVFCNGNLIATKTISDLGDGIFTIETSLSNTSCTNLSLRMYNLADHRTFVSEIDLVNPYPEPFSDVFWTGPKYFEGGWYPVQTSLDWQWGTDGEIILNPQFWWRSCDLETSSSCGEAQEYLDGVGQARISPCGEGGPFCSLEFEEYDLVDHLIMAKGSSANVNLIITGELLNNKVFLSSSNDELEVPNGSGIDCISSPCPFTVTASSDISPGSYLIQATATHSDGETICTPANMGVIVEGSWWQVVDADIWTRGSIASAVPDGNFFDLVGLGGFPGIPVYGKNNNLSVNGRISEEPFGWSAEADYWGDTYYDYDYFLDRVPEEVEDIWNEGDCVIEESEIGENSHLLDYCTSSYDGYYWLRTLGDLNILPGEDGGFEDLGENKVVLFVNGRLTIESKINVRDGKGFFMAVVKGDDADEPDLVFQSSDSGNAFYPNGSPELEGIYFVQGDIDTYRTDSQLWLRGTIVTLDGKITLARELAAEENDNPAEVFEFAPDQLMRLPHYFNSLMMSWKEVAP